MAAEPGEGPMRALDTKDVKHICEVLLANSQMPARAVNTVKEIVERRTLRLREALYPVFARRFDENDSPISTEDLERAQKELGNFLSYVKIYPEEFGQDFRDRIFRMYYLLVLELELRKLGRSISAPAVRSEDVVIRLSTLRDEIIQALGTWSAHDWRAFEEKLQEINVRFGFPDFSSEQAEMEQPLITDVPFAPFVPPPEILDANSKVIEDAMNTFFKDDVLPLNADVTKLFRHLESKVSRASENILSLYNLPAHSQERLKRHVNNIVMSYEFLVYAYQNIGLAYSIGEPLRAILCSALIEFFVDVGSFHYREMTVEAPFETVERMKKYIFYDQPHLNAQLIQQLEHIKNMAAQGRNALGGVNRSAEWHIDYLGEVLLR